MQPEGLQYTGCKGLPKSKGIDHLTVANTSSEKFFDKYVKTRTPVAFNDHVVDAKCALSNGNLWGDSYLKQKSGECKIKVETRSEGGTYGKGQEIHTTFGDFIDNMKEGKTYLTTQDLVYDEDGRPAIVSPPLTALTSDYPLTPSLFSNLVISNINIWFGYTKEYSTSGLHHDFHDNLYVLLRGEKRITLISPAEAHNLYTVGNISCVHPNGRINYKGQLPTRADGSDVGAEAALLAAERLQAIAERLERKGKAAAACGVHSKTDANSNNNQHSNDNGDHDSDNEDADHDNDSDISDTDEQELEDELDRALDDVLDAEMAEGADFESDGDDDYSDSDGAGDEGSDVEGSDGEGSDAGDRECSNVGESGAGSGDGSSEDESADSDCWDEEEGEDSDGGSGSESVSDRESENHNKGKGARKRDSRTADILGKGLVAALAASKRARTDTSTDASAAAGVKKGRTCSGDGKASSDKISHAGAEKGSLPANFSRVNTDLPLSVLQTQFPLYTELLQRGAAVEVVLKAGQMLYIPAGWFHEVRSRGADEATVSGTSSSAGSGANISSAQTSKNTASASSEYGGHLALNFWFHPPDNDSYDKPYKSDFWRKDFADRMKDNK